MKIPVFIIERVHLTSVVFGVTIVSTWLMDVTLTGLEKDVINGLIFLPILLVLGVIAIATFFLSIYVLIVGPRHISCSSQYYDRNLKRYVSPYEDVMKPFIRKHKEIQSPSSDEEKDVWLADPWDGKH